jgi:hypothetical protein
MHDTFLGISPFFHQGAEGHYDRFHLALSNSIQALDENYDSTHQYFGALGYAQHSQSVGVVDSAFKRPDGTIAFRKLLSLSRELESRLLSGNTYIYIYEGSISFLLTLKLLRRKKVNLNAIINFHQVELFRKLFQDPYIRNVYLKIIHRGLRGSKYFTLTSESLMSSRLLGSQINLNLEVFPIFSTFKDIGDSVVSDRPNLILFSGEFDEARMIQDLEGIPVTGSSSVILDSRFFSSASETFLEYLELHQYKIINQRVSEEDYASIFRSKRAAWFMYRAEVNTLGSSGRFLDALNFGLEVYVPAKSALAEFAYAWGVGVNVIDMDNLSVHRQGVPGSETGKPGKVFFDDTNAAKELMRLWALNSHVNSLSKVSTIDSSSFKCEHESLISIYLQWLLLQIALKRPQVVAKIGRGLRKLRLKGVCASLARKIK